MNLKKQFGIFKHLEIIVLLLLAVIFNFLAHSNFLFLKGIGILVFVSFIPIFYLSLKHNIKFSILYGFIYGYLTCITSCFWLFNFEKIALFLVSFVKGCEYAVILFFIRGVYRKIDNRLFVFIAPLVFVLFTFLFEKGVLAFPYLNPVYTLYRNISIIQCVRFLRIWGLLYFIIIFQISCVLFFLNNEHQFYKYFLFCYVICFVLNIVYGSLCIHTKKNTNRELKIIAVQHNSPSWNSSLEEYDKSLDTLISLTTEEIKKKGEPDLIVWSETAVTVPIIYYSNMVYDKEKSEIVKKFIEFSQNTFPPILTGTGDIDDEGEYYNAAVLFNKGIPLQKYYKRGLVPFTEYCPEDPLSKLLFRVLGFDHLSLFNKGKDSTIFTLNNGIRFGATICYEDVFPSYSQELKKKGADIIINLTNDSWGKSKVCQTQHLSIAVFRSVENNIQTLRVTNSGVSCLITQNGVIKDALNQFEKKAYTYNLQLL